MSKLCVIAQNLKSHLDQHRPVSQTVWRGLHDELMVNWVFHSNALKGPGLTREQTRQALNGRRIEGRSLREHLQATNCWIAILRLEQWAQQACALTQWHVLQLHQVLMTQIDFQEAGWYRRAPAQLSAISTFESTPAPTAVSQAMQTFVEQYQAGHVQQHPIEGATWVHCELMRIHPFTHGNHSVARMLMSLYLMKAGYPATFIHLEQRPAYDRALEVMRTTGDCGMLSDVVAHSVIKGFEPYWQALGLQEQAHAYLQSCFKKCENQGQNEVSRGI